MDDGLKPEERAKIIGVLTILFPDAKIYLYGSRARGTHREFSDVDIAIDAGHKLSPRFFAEARGMLEASLVPYNFDVVDFHCIPVAMKEAILREGILWQESKMQSQVFPMPSNG